MLRSRHLTAARAGVAAVALLLPLIGSTASASRVGPTGTCGGTWTVEPSPSPVGSGLFGAGGASPTDVWAVGFYGVGASSRTLVEHWDGSSWSLVDAPNGPGRDNFLQSVSAVASDDVWAVGYNGDLSSHSLIEHWDGTQWQIVPSPNPGRFATRLFGVAALASDDVWAVGDRIDSFDTALVMHWDGAAWSLSPGADIPGDYSYLSGVSGTGPNDVWAVGQFTNGHDGIVQPLTEHWDGTSWTAVPALHHQQSATYTTGVAAVSPTQVLATGARSESLKTLGLVWDGASWSTTISEHVAHTVNILYDVSADPAGDAWSVGFYYIPGDSQDQTLIEQWDGSAWRIVDSPNDGPTSTLYGVATLSATEAWAVGINNAASGFIEHYCA